MPQKYTPRYTPEYRAKVIELVRKGQKPSELAKHYEPSAQTIANWAKQADIDAGRRHDGLTSEEREELRTLRRKVKTLEQEREFLGKAAAWFAQEAGSKSKPRSS